MIIECWHCRHGLDIQQAMIIDTFGNFKPHVLELLVHYYCDACGEENRIKLGLPARAQCRSPG